MFFILSKLFFYILLNPVFWLLGLLGYSRYTQNPKRQKWAVWTLIIGVVVMTNPGLTNVLIDTWELDLRPMNTIEESYDVGILLGGFSEKGQMADRLKFASHPNRMTQTIELYKVGKIKKILITGCTGSVFADQYCEAITAKSFLMRLGIPEQDILVEAQAKNTYENAKFTKTVLEQETPNGSYLLITSAFHMRRSIACFKKQGLDIDYFCVDSIRIKSQNILDDIIPQTDAIRFWMMIVKEWFGFLSYWMVGYI